MAYNKYYVYKEQVSRDNGLTWSYTGNETASGSPIATYDTLAECEGGTFDGKFKATYSGGQTYSAACDSDTTLTTATTKPSGYTASAMTSAEIGSCVTSISEGAFTICRSLSSVTIPDSVTEIGDVAFNGCALTGFTLPSSLTYIGENAFYLCSINSTSGAVTNIHIPSGVTYIGEDAFRDVEYTSLGFVCSLTGITVDIGNTTYDSRNNCNAIIETNTNKLIKGCRYTTIPDSVTEIENNAFYDCVCLAGVTLPAGLTRIGSDAFLNCPSLTSITIPNSVTEIGHGAFYNCSGITSVTLPTGLTNISRQTFVGCRGLTSVTIPDSITEIGDSAFWNCSHLQSITIPSGVTFIDWEAFYGCTRLTSITCLATTPPRLGITSGEHYAFDDTNNCPIYVPSQSQETYKSASGWSEYASRIQAIP